MRSSCVFILTHGRPDRVHTLRSLRKAGYTGSVYFVVDDEDAALGEYRRRYGDAVLVFSKSAIAATFDQGDNFSDRRAVVFARNACFDLARSVGVRYFVQLDDDYTGFFLRFNSSCEYGAAPIDRMDDVFEAVFAFLDATPARTVAFSQGGDHMGGSTWNRAGPRLLRKAMNAFFCSVDRPFRFVGRINEDVNTYVLAGLRGELVCTVMQAQLIQLQTQSNPGGMTEMYSASGTYVKSFYTVMYAPACARVVDMGVTARRLHHRIDWDACAVRILPESARKVRTLPG